MASHEELISMPLEARDRVYTELHECLAKVHFSSFS